MIAKIKNSFLDYLGISASVLCAIHCAALPFLVSITMMPSWMGLHNHTFDFIILAVALVLIYQTIYQEYKRTSYRLPLALAISGIALIILSKVFHSSYMIIPSVIGGVMIASAHFIKIKRSAKASS